MKRTSVSALFVSIILVFCCNNFLQAQSNKSKIKEIEAAFPIMDQLYKNYAAQNHLPGIVYGLVVDGKLIHTWNAGYSNLAEKIQADNQSAYHIASMTKSFTAMAILRLRDEGKLRLDDPVSKYIPEMKGQKFPSTDATEITVRNLLTHGAGFPEDNPWGDRQLAKTDQELINLIKKGISFSNGPGLKFEYSNLGFTMLGYIIGKVAGGSYQNYITENILIPLGMTNTYWEYTKVPAQKLVMGYNWIKGEWIPQPLLHSGAYGAMGGMITTLEDFSKYVAFHLSAWPPRDAPETGPVRRSSVREMQFPWNFNGLMSQYKYPGGRSCPTVSAYGYGLGWSRDCDGKVFIGHGGGLPGFGCNWRSMPDYGIGIIVLSNITYGSRNLSAVNVQALDTLIQLARLTPREIPISAILNQRKTELTKLLPGWENPQAVQIFAENFFLDYFIDDLRKEATKIFREAGKIKHIGEIIPLNNLRGFFRMEGEFKDVEIGFTLTPENPPMIQEYHIEAKEKLK